MANDQKEKDYNPSQEDYEAKFDNASSTSTSGHDSDEVANLSTRESKPDGSHDDVELGPDEQAKIDQMETGLRENNLYDPSGTQQHHKPSLQSRIKGLANTRGKKAGWIGGGIVGLLLGGFLTLFPVLGPVHIFSNLMDHNFEYNDYYRRNRTRRVVRSVLNNNATNRNLSETPFKLKADLVDFEKFEARMQSRGWGFEYDADGKAIGIIDPEGVRVDIDPDSGIPRQDLNRLIDDTVPAYKMNKRMRTRALVTTFTGPTRSFKWTEFLRRDKTVDPDFETALFKKQSGLDANTDTEGVRERRTSEQDGETSTSYEEGSETSATEEARNEIIEQKLNGASNAEALEAGTSRLKSSLPSGRSVALAGVAAGCVAYTIFEQELSAAFERIASALRIGATYMLATNEIQQGGNIDAGEVGELFGQYNNEEGSFASSAAWQRATGQPVTGEELNPEYHVIQDDDAKGQVQNVLESTGAVVASIPFSGAVCGFVGSFFFAALDIIVAGFQTLATCATVVACAAGIGWVVGSEVAFDAMISALLAASVSNIAGFLIDHPVQAAAFLDQTFSLLSSEESRTGVPKDNTAYNQEVAAFKIQQNKNQSFTERYFAVENSNSLTANLARIKMSSSNLSPTKALASLFNMPGESLIAATTAQNAYAQTDIEFENYGFQKYSYNNDYINDDPFELAEEVVELIESDSSIELDEDNGRYERDFAVMCMGYVPEQGIVDKSPLNGLFLSRYSNPSSGAEEAKRRNDAFQKICIDEAKADPQLYAKIGRFVDDIELISSIIELTGDSVPTTTSTSGSGGSPTGGGSGGGAQNPEPTPTPPEVCDPNNPIGDECLD